MSKLIMINSSPRLLVPTDISSLAMWFTAKDTNSVILNGSNVQQWQDKSGFNRHISAPAAANRPLWVSAHTDGLPLIRLDGTDDILVNETTGTNGLINTTTLSLFRFRAVVGADIPVSLGSSGGVSGSVRALFRASGQPTMSYSQWGERLDSPYSVDTGGNFHLWGMRNASTSPNTFLGRDGIYVSRNISHSATVNGFIVGSIMNSLVEYMSAIDIRETLVFSSSLSTSNLQKAEGYIMHQWNLQGLLPSNHPFRNRPPLVTDV